jgi:hypothetical protein
LFIISNREMTKQNWEDDIRDDVVEGKNLLNILKFHFHFY